MYFRFEYVFPSKKGPKFIIKKQADFFKLNLTENPYF
jgi:hypothetical protein